MARQFTAIDAYRITTELVKMATGQSDITPIDSSNFVSAGETLVSNVKNTLNNLSILIGNTYVAARRRKDRFYLIQSMNNDMYTSRMRKISFYATNPEPAGFVNTDLFTNFKDGYDNGSNSGDSTASMWKQNYKATLEVNFGGESVFDVSITIPEYAFRNAFRSGSELARFLNGMMLELENDISRAKEAWNRMNVLNKIAGVYDIATSSPGSVINLTAAFNAKFGTTYTSNDLRTTHLKEFYAFFTETFKLASEWLTYDSIDYHWTPPKDADGNDLALIRTTPYNKQRVILYEPMFVSAEANVLPEIFNPSYLDINTQYEGVMYWQSKKTPAAINVTPAIPDVTDETGTQIKGNAVNIPFVVGMIYDVDGLMTSYKLDSAATSPLEAKKMYRNHFWHIARGAINDFTENCIIFTMEDAK